MLKSFKAHVAIVVLFGASCAFGAQGSSDQEPSRPTQSREESSDRPTPTVIKPEDRRTPTFSFNEPALAAAMIAGGSASFINWVTLRGNLWAVRRDLRKPVKVGIENFMHSTQELPGAEAQPGVLNFNYEAWKKSIDAETKRLGRHGKLSIVRRTTMFKAFVFGVPAYAAYHAVAQSKQLRQVVSGCFQQVQDRSN